MARADDLDAIDAEAIPDKRLELLFACAHPAIAADVRTPLMLNTVLGFEARDIAAASAFRLPPWRSDSCAPSVGCGPRASRSRSPPG